MKPRLLFLTICILVVAQELCSQTGSILFDSGWKFHRGGAQGAERPAFDDSGWRNLDLPHDWSIEDLPGTDSPFHPDAISQVSGGFTTGGTGWYRKRFTLTEEQRNKRVVIQFDGIYMNSEVWINGSSLGTHPYGYTTFWYDITDKIRDDKENVLAVKVKNEGENSRWYSGSGIYRHVWLRVTDRLHIAQWGTGITTPETNSLSAKVKTETALGNNNDDSENARLITRIIDSKGSEVAKAESDVLITAKGKSVVSQEFIILNPSLWSIETPVLYTAVSELYNGADLADREETIFGVRTISFDAISGFQLNGKQLKLKGGCYHHDNGPLGAKSFDRAEERRVELLKASGFNALRCSHNPPSKAFLDACDRLGMLVINETFDMWQTPKNPADYSLYFTNWWQKDVESLILRDRNHPSVILWSIGNEIPGMDNPEVVETAVMQAAFVRKTDPTRPVIAAVNNLNPAKDPYFAALDIAGYNYGSGGDHLKPNVFYADHLRVPARIMIQTESYPLEAFQSWMDVVDHPWVLGDFVWTAFDYIGEASIGWLGYWQESSFYPWNLAFCGDIDICGWKRPQSYYRDALWMENQVSLFVKPPVPSFEENQNRMSWSKWHWYDAVADWNWNGHEGKPLEVSVYSSCDEVELVINNRSLGRKKTGRATRFTATWLVPFEPGELMAVGYKGRKKVNSSVLRTAGDPEVIKLTADRTDLRADGQDLCYISVELNDASGIRHPKAENRISFKVDGPATIIGTGNANPVSTESYTGKERKAWQGRCLVILRTEDKPGNIVLTAAAEGMKAASVSVQSLKP